MFPATDATILSGGILGFQRTARTGRRSVTTDQLTLLLPGEPVDCPFTRRAFILIILGVINKIALTKIAFGLIAGDPTSPLSVQRCNRFDVYTSFPTLHLLI